MMEKYNPANDPAFQTPYPDMDEWRDLPVKHRYIHGGFSGTDVKFSFFFPRKEDYQGRFYHFTAPVTGSEDASIQNAGADNKIAFAVSHGAYFVETNMGVLNPFAPIADPTIIYRASAAAAEYSREVARKLFGEHRPFGYIFGGSGGAFKSISCFENADAWDGAAPFVVGSAMAMPNMFTVRAHARRVLRHKWLQIADAIEPGSGRGLYDGLNGEEREALEEVTKMGFPPKTWFMHETIGDGALPVLTPLVNALDAAYYEDFWNVEGYLGAKEGGSAQRDRIRFTTQVAEVFVPQSAAVPADDSKTGVDDAWQRLANKSAENCRLRLANTLAGSPYVCGTTVTILSGASAGYTVPLESLCGDVAVIGNGFGQPNLVQKLSAVQPGDEVLLDNSNYIAIQTYHRHQLPADYYEGWQQFRNAEGLPNYPQRPMLIGPPMSIGGCGSLQTGCFRGKMISVNALMDESAFPWNADRYRKQVVENGNEANYRLWYVENAMHGDHTRAYDETHVVSYAGVLHQALLDLAQWVENGTEPAASTVYSVQEGQVFVPEDAKARCGIQPVVTLRAEKQVIKIGERVELFAAAELPDGNSEIIAFEWCLDETKGFESGAFFNQTATTSTTYSKAGTYFPVVRVWAQRSGEKGDAFTQVSNLCRARVVVE